MRTHASVQLIACTILKVPAKPKVLPSAPGDEGSIVAYNQRGLAARADRRYAEAIAIFREGILTFPNEATLHNNLAVTLEDSGDSEGALGAYREAVRIDPSLWAALFGIGTQLMRSNNLTEAQTFFERTLEHAPQFVPAHLAMYELAQIRGERLRAIEHQRIALQHQQLFSEISPTPKRRVLALMAPGDWQANVPVDFLFNRADTTLHKLYVLNAEQLAAVELPAYDVIFNAIAESDESARTLELCAQFIAAQGKPFINNPAAILNTNRVRLAELLRSAHARVPATVRLSRNDVADGNIPIAFPLIIRPIGSHAGHDLEKAENPKDLASYLRRVAAGEFYVMKFVDYRNADGYYRKFRIIMIDGTPFAFHMAISKNWMVHYYNAPMAEFAWMRAEEERFLAHFESVFDLKAQHALREIARLLELDYFGIDCAIGADGNVLVFEADPGVIVHMSDPAELFPYKHKHVPRIFRAIERAMDSRIARSS